MWIIGSRKKQSASTKNYTGYRLATRYSFSEELSLKASYKHSMRLPLARKLLGNGTTVYADLQLKPESSNNYNRHTISMKSKKKTCLTTCGRKTVNRKR